MSELQPKGIDESGPAPAQGLQAINQIHGSFDGSGLKVALVVSRFNRECTEALLKHAVRRLIDHGVEEEGITVYWVPGAFEIPGVLKRLATKGSESALIALGAVVEGETNHADVISREIAHAVSRIGLAHGIPVIDTVVTAPTLEQVAARCLPAETGRGAYAADAAVEMATLMNTIH